MTSSGRSETCRANLPSFFFLHHPEQSGMNPQAIQRDIASCYELRVHGRGPRPRAWSVPLDCPGTAHHNNARCARSCADSPERPVPSKWSLRTDEVTRDLRPSSSPTLLSVAELLLDVVGHPEGKYVFFLKEPTFLALISRATMCVRQTCGPKTQLSYFICQ